MSDCVIWPKATNACGYGILGRDGKSWLAHRWVWTQERGPIPEGMVVCHTCDVPACVNIDHLFLGTVRDNVRDMAAKGRHRGQRTTHCPKGHPYDRANTYIHGDGRKRGCRPCRNTASVEYRARKKVSA